MTVVSMILSLLWDNHVTLDDAVVVLATIT